MAFEFLKKEDFPSERGQKATIGKVSIADNGQLSLNSYIVENYVKDNTNAAIAVDGAKLALVFCSKSNMPKVLGKGFSLASTWSVNRATLKDKEGNPIKDESGEEKKSPTATISLATVFAKNEIEVSEGTKLKGTEDDKNVQWIEKDSMLIITLDKLEESKVQPREKKEKPTTKDVPKETVKVEYAASDDDEEEED